MLSAEDVMQLIQSLIWLLAGVGVFIVGMNFMSDALEKSAGEGMKKMLGRISNNRFSGVGIGAGVTAIIQSSSATSVMVIGLVNAGVMTLMQATPIIMGANIGTTITGVLVALKNDYFNMLMYLFAFAGVMMGFFKKEKIKMAGLLCSGLGLIFVGLNVMSSEQAFGNPLVESMFQGIFSVIDFPLLLILVGVIFTALIQSSSAATGVVITMVGTGVLPLDLALFIVLGANIGTCVTALLASVGANANSKRVALIHFTFNVIGTVIFTAIVWIFKNAMINLLTSLFPGNDTMSLQMRVSVFHVIFNVTTTVVLLPFVKRLVQYSCAVIRDKQEKPAEHALKYVDERLLSMPSVALMQAKKEIDHMLSLVEENIRLSVISIGGNPTENAGKIAANEETIDFTNGALTRFLIKLSACVDERDEQRIGAYFHVLNDLERIGDHAENFHEIGQEMLGKKLTFSETALSDIKQMHGIVINMIAIAKNKKRFLNAEFRIKNILDAISHATCAMSIDVDAKAIVVCSVTGTTARMVSRFRSPVDIVGLTTDKKVWRKLALSWGVTPMLTEKFNSVDVMFYKAKECARSALNLNPGDNVVLTAGPINGQCGNTNTIKVEQIGS